MERTHLQIIRRLTAGEAAKSVATATGYTRRWVSVIVGRYDEAGVGGLGDRRRSNPGAGPLLDDARRDRLAREIERGPPDRGLWTGRSVAQWITGLLGRLVSPRRATDHLRRLGFSRQVPRPRHAGADLAAQEGFEARFRAQVQARRLEDPDVPLEAWAFDEHRLGLEPVPRRVWAPRGSGPPARGHHRFRWLWVHGFVRPARASPVGSWPRR